MHKYKILGKVRACVSHQGITAFVSRVGAGAHSASPAASVIYLFCAAEGGGYLLGGVLSALDSRERGHEGQGCGIGAWERAEHALQRQAALWHADGAPKGSLAFTCISGACSCSAVLLYWSRDQASLSLPRGQHWHPADALGGRCKGGSWLSRSYRAAL